MALDDIVRPHLGERSMAVAVAAVPLVFVITGLAIRHAAFEGQALPLGPPPFLAIAATP